MKASFHSKLLTCQQDQNVIKFREVTLNQPFLMPQIKLLAIIKATNKTPIHH